MSNEEVFKSTTTTLYYRNTILLDKLDQNKNYIYRINAFNEGGDSKTYLQSSLDLIDPVPGELMNVFIIIQSIYYQITLSIIFSIYMLYV